MFNKAKRFITKKSKNVDFCKLSVRRPVVYDEDDRSFLKNNASEINFCDPLFVLITAFGRFRLNNWP